MHACVIFIKPNMDLCISAFQDLKEKINIQFISKLILFHLEKMDFDMLYFAGGDLD